MARRLGLVIMVLLLAAGLSGCASKGKGPKDQPGSANFSDLGLQATATTGIIRGIVVDDAIRPLANASVGTTLADGTARNTTSAPDGAFGFANLPPGTYFLKVSKRGFIGAQASADVVAGVAEPPIVKVLLKADPSTLPYVTQLQYDAFIACSFTLAIVSFAACGLVADQTNNAFLVDYAADKPPNWIQTEAIWSSTQALGNELGLSITDFHKGPQIGVNGTAGPSPIYITVNQSTAAHFEYGTNNTITIRLFSSELSGTDVVPEEDVHAVWKSTLYGPVNSTGAPELYQANVVDHDPTGLLTNPFDNPDCVKYPVLFNACFGVGGVGMALQQKVTVFTQIFYGYTPTPGWRFSSGEPVPPPPQ